MFLGLDGKESAHNVGDLSSIPGLRKIPWRREWLPTSEFLPGEFHGQRSLVGYSAWSHKELDTTEQLTLSLSFFSPGWQSLKFSTEAEKRSWHWINSQPTPGGKNDAAYQRGRINEHMVQTTCQWAPGSTSSQRFLGSANVDWNTYSAQSRVVRLSTHTQIHVEKGPERQNWWP